MGELHTVAALTLLVISLGKAAPRMVQGLRAQWEPEHAAFYKTWAA